ncbi:hypothetical protein [Nocardioides sp.]|uniref:hypothetical protein n=1 Tax=Nocardioides sp. TaxID=35761 RepID=UPI002722019E|nr:hypothetical protein [Nocardioides sp.]MDO9456721.1 hypothetical protein [Nocardioides sp.]
MAEDLVMTDTVAAPIIEHFRDLSAEFDNSGMEVGGHRMDTITACGEMSQFVEDGANAYLISWGQTLEFCGETAALIAGNTNVFEISLERLDTDLSHLPTI